MSFLIVSSSTEVILTLSPSNAPPVLGEDGSIAKRATLLPCDAHILSSLSIKQDFPTPGAPVIAKEPHTFELSRRLSGLNIERICCIVVVPFSILVNVLASERRFPFNALLTWSTSKVSPHAVDCQCQSLSAPTPTSVIS